MPLTSLFIIAIFTFVQLKIHLHFAILYIQLKVEKNIIDLQDYVIGFHLILFLEQLISFQIVYIMIQVESAPFEVFQCIKFILQANFFIPFLIWWVWVISLLVLCFGYPTLNFYSKLHCFHINLTPIPT